MAPDADPSSVQLHIWAIAHRSPDEDRQVRDHLHQRCWPGGLSDRLEQGALPWLKRWRAGEGIPIAAVCSCAHGRCGTCN